MRKFKFGIVLSVVGSVVMGISGCSISRGESAVSQTAIPTQAITIEETEEPRAQTTQTPATGQVKGKGKLTKSTYENEFMDLKFKLPKGFVMASEEQIKSLLESQGADVTDANESYEMLAYEEGTGANAIVFTIEEPNAGVSCAQYFKQITEQFATQNKLVNILDGIKEVTQWGHEYTTMDLELKINGVNCIERYCCRKINNLFVCVILASKETGNFDKMMQGFSKYGKVATETPEETVMPELSIAVHP